MKRTNNIEHRQEIKEPETAPPKNRDVGMFLSSLPAWALLVLIAASYTAVIALSNYIGYQRFRSGISQPAPTDAAVGSVLALLAFMLGFAFSSTWTRFIRRNSYVVAHAKAVLTAYLRASLITERQKRAVRKLLNEYTALLLGIHTSADLEKALPRINAIHVALWEETASLVKEDIDSELRSLFTAAVNDLITVAMERKTVALFIRIPNAIWNSLLILATIGMAAFGYQAGMSGVYNLFEIPLLPVAFGLVLVLIADLNSRDSKRQFQVTRRPLREVLEMMKEEIP